MLNRRSFLAADRRLCRPAACSPGKRGGGQPAWHRRLPRCAARSTPPTSASSPARLTTRARLSPRCCARHPTATCRCSCRRAPMSSPTCRCRRVSGSPACPARRASSMAATAICCIAEDAEHIELTGIGLRRRQPLDRRPCARPARPPPRRSRSSSTIARSSAAARTASRSRRVAGRIERSKFRARPTPASIRSRPPACRSSGNTVSDCANGGILVHRWQPAEDGTIVTRQPRRAHRRRAAAAPARTATASTSSAPTTSIVSNNIVSRLRLLGDPRQQRQQHADHRQHLLAVGRNRRSMPNSPSKARSSTPTSSTAPPTASRSSISTKAAAWRVCSGNIVRNLVDRRPLPGRSARLRRRHHRRGRLRRHRQRRRERAALRHADRLGAVHAQRGRHRQRHPQGRNRHRRHRGRRRGLGGHLRQCHRRRPKRRHRRPSLGRAGDRRSRLDQAMPAMRI